MSTSYRLSQSKRIGPFHIRFSEPIGGRGRPYMTIGIHTPLGYLRMFRTPTGPRR